MLAASLFFIVGALIMTFANGFYVLVLGRIVTGFGVGKLNFAVLK